MHLASSCCCTRLRKRCYYRLIHLIMILSNDMPGSSRHTAVLAFCARRGVVWMAALGAPVLRVLYQFKLCQTATCRLVCYRIRVAVLSDVPHQSMRACVPAIRGWTGIPGTGACFTSSATRCRRRPADRGFLRGDRCRGRVYFPD